MTTLTGNFQDQLLVESSTHTTVTAMSEEEKVFRKYRERMSKTLMTTHSRLATLCAGKKLINMQKALNVQRYTKEQRATALLQMLIVKMDETGNPSKIWEAFQESIEDIKNLQQYLDKQKTEEDKITENPGRSVKAVLEREQANIISHLEYNLESVAGRLLKDVLSDEEHQTICNPEADYNRRVMDEILDGVLCSIQEDKELMYVFIEDVLKEIGGPVDRLAKALEEDLKGTGHR